MVIGALLTMFMIQKETTCATTETVTNQNVYSYIFSLKKQKSGHMLQYEYMENTG